MSISFGGLAITGATPFDGSGENGYTAGSGHYTGIDAIEWLVICIWFDRFSCR